MTPKTRFLAAVAVAILAFLVVSESLQLHQDHRSREFQRKLSEALTAGKPVPLFSVIDEDVPHSAAVCILGPYQDAREYLPPKARVGLDSWLLSIDEASIAVVVLTASDEASEIIRLDRMRIDMRVSRCFQRDDDPRVLLDHYEADGRMVVSIQSKDDPK